MYKFSLVVFSLLLLLVHEPLHAGKEQENTWTRKYSYSLFGFGAGMQNVSFLSPVYYNMGSMSFKTGSHRTRGEWISTTNQSFSPILSTASNSNIMSSIPYSLQHSYARKLPAAPLVGQNLQTFVGLGYWLDLDVVIKESNQNNPVYYNLNNLLHLALYIEYNIAGVVIHNELLVPFAGIFSASEYSSSIPLFAHEDDAKFLDALHPGSFNANKQISNRLSIDYGFRLLGSSRTARATYEVSAQQFSLNNNTKHFVLHTLSIGFLFNKKIEPYVHQ